MGSATAVRIALVGRALQSAGINFRLLHCGPSPTPLNKNRSGTYDGIPYEYTTVLHGYDNFLLKLLVYAWAVFGLTWRLVRIRLSGVHTAVYLYVLRGALNLYVGWLCKLIGLPVVQELCEWWPGEPTCSKFDAWLYRKAIFASAKGIVAISPIIEDRVRKRAADVNPRLKVYRLPSLVDVERFAQVNSSEPAPPLDHLPSFVWCGTGWLQDILFLVRTVALVRERGYQFRLLIIGSHPKAIRELILEHAAEHGVPAENLVLTGWVDNTTLQNAYRSATALLLPLWDDDRSRTRMPNKLPEYLGSGRPVITAPVGVVAEILEDSVNACLVAPGDEAEFAETMIQVLENPDWARRIGARGRETCLMHFDYRLHAKSLTAFFLDCAGLH